MPRLVGRVPEGEERVPVCETKVVHAAEAQAPPIPGCRVMTFPLASHVTQRSAPQDLRVDPRASLEFPGVWSSRSQEPGARSHTQSQERGEGYKRQRAWALFLRTTKQFLCAPAMVFVFCLFCLFFRAAVRWLLPVACCWLLGSLPLVHSAAALLLVWCCCWWLLLAAFPSPSDPTSEPLLRDLSRLSASDAPPTTDGKQQRRNGARRLKQVSAVGDDTQSCKRR